jgi:hypothetical protein
MARPPKDIALDITKMQDATVDQPQDLTVDADPSLANGVQPASATSRTATRLGLELISPLTKFGSKQAPTYKVTPVPDPVETPVEEITPDPAKALGAGDPYLDPEPDVITTTPDEIPDVPEPTMTAPDPISPEELEARMAAREAALEGPRIAPSGKGENVQVGEFNTKFYDSDQLAATVASAAQSDPNLKSRTVKSFYDRALLAGVPKKHLDLMFKGIPLESKVGDHKLAENLAGLQILHDISAKRVDELMAKAATNQLDEAGKLELREAIAQHDMIYSTLKGAKRDVARSMNVFKSTYESDTGLTVTEVRNILDGLGGDDQLKAMAERYVAIDPKKKGARAARNKMLERGLIRKGWDAVIYNAQGNFLTDYATHLYNAIAGAGMIIEDIPTNVTAAGIVSPVRQRLVKMFGGVPDEERAMFIDVAARASGIFNGILDGFRLGTYYLKNGKSQYKGETEISPLSAQYFSDTPLKILGKEIYRTGNLEGTAFGKLINAAGIMPNAAMKGLGFVDEIIGGTAQRMELHYQAYRAAHKVYEEKTLEGATHKEALKEAQDSIANLLVERPADIEADMQSFRKMVTLQDDIDTSTVVGMAWDKGNKLISTALLKPLVLFTKTVTNIGIEAGARIPVINFLSPRFYTEYMKGGRNKDIAIARVINGGSLLLGGYYLGMNGRVTGRGPSDTEEKRTLRSLGWQEHALVFDADEFTEDNLNIVRAVLGDDAITIGEGQFEGKIFVSLLRMEPLSLPFIMGGSMAQAYRYGAYDDRNGFAQRMMDAGMAGLADYTTSVHPMMVIRDMMGIVNQRQTDGGERFTAVVNEYFKQQGNILIAGTPFLGITNSSLAGRIERWMNPGSEPTELTQDQAEWFDETWAGNVPGIKGFFEAYNQWTNKVPVFGRDLDAKLDEWGDPIGVDPDLVWSPTRITKGKPDEAKELVAALRHGISIPGSKINGMEMPSEVQERYKALYAKEILIDGVDMRQAIIKDVTDLANEYDALGYPAEIGVMQDAVNSVVSEYRAAARERLFGKMVTAPDGSKVFTLEGVGPEYGLGKSEVEFEGIALKMQKQMYEARLYGR